MILIGTIVGFLKDRSIRNLSISTLLVLLTGMIIYHYIEGWKLLDSLYFSVITLTTVGYGDFSPQTDFGKIFTMFYVLTGIGIIFGYINTLYLKRIDKIKDRSLKLKKRGAKEKTEK